MGLAGAPLKQRLAVAGQLAQLPDRPGRHEAGADQAVLDRLGDPGRIGHIRLMPEHVPEMLGVQQPALDVVFQQVVDRLPAHPGGLHPHHLDLVAGQPVPQQHQPGGGGPNRAGLAVPPAVPIGNPSTRLDRGLVHLQPGAALDEPVRLAPPCRWLQAMPPGGASSCRVWVACSC
jgi:hypothetical protein